MPKRLTYFKRYVPSIALQTGIPLNEPNETFISLK